jgi:preprotein translocase subunit secG
MIGMHASKSCDALAKGYIPNDIYLTRLNMASKKKGQGFQSAAGLIRYFDNETSKGPVLKPWSVVGIIAVVIAVICIAGFVWPAA